MGTVISVYKIGYSRKVQSIFTSLPSHILAATWELRSEKK